MLISVITPSLNQGTFIERTIQSVLAQKGNFRLEYIIVDGKSTDQTESIVAPYKTELTWISEKDGGQSEAINKGFAAASGDIFAWLNADDTYEPGALRKVAEAYEKKHFDWCIGKCRIIDRHDKEIRGLITKYKVLKCRTYTYHRLLTKNFVPQPAVFIPRKTYNRIGPLRSDRHYTMDYEYWLRIGRTYDPFFLDEYLANFRWHGESKCGKGYPKVTSEAYLTARSFATRQQRFPLLQNALHCQVLNLVYRLYDILAGKDRR